MRDVEKATFVKISKELHMTQPKARSIYESFYHKLVLELVRELKEKAESNEEKCAIYDYYFKGNKSYKKIYDMLTKNITG